MAAAEQSTGEHRRVRDHASFPFLAVLCTLGAALAFAGVGAAIRWLGGNPAGMVAGAIVMTLAGILLLVPFARAGGVLLAWNGLGIAAGMFVIGILSFGALMIFPLALIALALASWPRAESEPVPTWAVLIVQVGGFFLPFMLYPVLDTIATDLANLVDG